MPWAVPQDFRQAPGFLRSFPVEVAVFLPWWRLALASSSTALTKAGAVGIPGGIGRGRNLEAGWCGCISIAVFLVR